MALWILMGIAFLFVSWLVIEEEGLVSGLFVGAIAAAIVGVVFLGSVTVITCWTSSNPTHIDSSSVAIVSLRDGQGMQGSVHGSFLSIDGSFASYPSYTWYQRNPDGSLSGKQILDNGWNEVKVYETNAEKPHVERIAGYSQRTLPSWLLPWNIHNKAEFTTLYKFYVPKGAVVRGYTLNSE